ncbi:hypothetical protein KVV02_000011 [Mortierella alpina]|uniref:Uncharacterized protein n=1 Tax=Mortierella alpina TaxID=64518 RepID=A0A9P8A6J9_MORAP|nr:hypothetical protein KVV02_000011 [Mortierella alpina]
MAPSLPGTGSRRNATRGSRSSPAASIKGEDSFKREGRSSRGAEKHDSDSEEQSKGSSSPSRPRRPARKIPSKSKQRRTGDMKDGDRDEDEDEDEEDQEGAEPDEDASTKNEPSEPPEDVEEIEGEIDEAGESKVTKDGELLGGRQYRCRSFKLPARGDRIYMLSMDPARVLGFRDSYLFFLKNPQLVRVNTTVEERQWMIENGMLMANFKSKLIAVVTARSIFKSFGARIIKNGRSRVDDYYEANATEEDALNDSDGDASRTGNGNAPGSVNGGNSYQDEDAPSGSARRKRNLTHDDSQRLITGLNWMYESAMAVRNFNARLKELRKETPRFMDPHTNLEQVPSALQPTRCEIQPVSEPRPAKKPRHSNDTAISAVEAPVPLSSEPPVFAVPRSIGPIVDLNVKVTIKPGAPLPPQIHDPSVWAVIPEDVRRTLQEEVLLQAIDEDGDQDSTKYPIAIMPGHYQAAFPL